MLNILVLNGPSLNLLGIREKEHYGSLSLVEIEKNCANHFSNQKVFQSWMQSNHEGELIDKIHAAILGISKVDAIVINPAAYSHYSVAIMDALKCFTGPKVEVHLSDISKREDFRRISLTSESCDRMICGMGQKGYIMAIEYIINLKNQERA